MMTQCLMPRLNNACMNLRAMMWEPKASKVDQGGTSE